ncbi:MAG: hypothetical protein KAG98_00505 [Lentisphaeria bacterium]|nr:hypothetical protein [Lentisphaeria bacterium]
MGHIFTTIAIVSLYLLSIALVPWMVIRLPSDYFLKEKRERHLSKGASPFIKSISFFLKNAVGWVLFLAGISMLFLPGQGMLTIIAGVFLMDFPYKFKIEKKIITQPIILKMFNKIRRKAHKEPFRV